MNIAGLCRIGRDVVIGMGANALSEITIGYGAIVGAGALVNQNVASGSVVMGVPARVHSPG